MVFHSEPLSTRVTALHYLALCDSAETLEIINKGKKGLFQLTVSEELVCGCFVDCCGLVAEQYITVRAHGSRGCSPQGSCGEKRRGPEILTSFSMMFLR